jgi:hypothetical protein
VKRIWGHIKKFNKMYIFKAEGKEQEYNGVQTWKTEQGIARYLDSFASHDMPTGIPSVVVGRRSATS